MIAEQLAPKARLGVAWVGDELDDSARSAFRDRGLHVQACKIADLDDNSFLAGLRGIVLVQNRNKGLLAVNALAKCAVNALNHGCDILVRVISTAEGSPQSIVNALEELKLPVAGLDVKDRARLGSWYQPNVGDPLQPCITIFYDVKWKELANALTGQPVERAPNEALRIEPKALSDNLELGRKLLLQRAFFDCATVHLVPQFEGKSDIQVFLAFAGQERTPKQIRWPQPYFVKVGAREKVLAEFHAYANEVDPYIPFHLGPHLIPGRCGLGAHDGIIVGDYVVESEPLISCLKGRRATTAISCLFDRTLSGWYIGAQSESDSSKLTKFLLSKCPQPTTFPDKRLANATKHGAKVSPQGLREVIADTVITTHKSGTIHGDLHARNVMVRGNDAILIDFAKCNIGPLSYDFASLEASLFLDALEDITEASVLGEWHHFSTRFYDDITINFVPLHPGFTDPHHWLVGAIRQIRLYSTQIIFDQKEYSLSLAVAFLRQASYAHDCGAHEEFRRTVAYSLAHQLLKQKRE